MTTPELPGAGSQQSSPHQAQQFSLTQQDPGISAYPFPQQPAKVKKPLNVLGLIALIAAAVGFIFACLPGALIIGWILLPAAFVLAIVSLFIKEKAKWMGVAALITSIVGTIVGFVVFFAVVSTSFDNAFGSGNTKVVEPSNSAATDGATEKESTAESGTREKPYPIGSTIESKDWRVVIKSVSLNANSAVAAASQFNDPPAKGTQYILVNYSATYIGDDSEGGMPAFVSVEYVTPAGNTVNDFDKFVLAPKPIDTTSTLYKGATATGNKVFEVPASTAGQGVLAVRPGMLGDKVFVAVK